MAKMKREDRAFALPIALFYGAVFIIYGMQRSVHAGLARLAWPHAGEISVVMAAPLFLRVFVTPTVAVAADREGAHRHLSDRARMARLGVCPGAVADAVVLADTLVRRPADGLLIRRLMPLIETIAVQGMRSRGLDYGRMRLWGSLTFVVASFLGGIVITQYGGGAGVWLIAVGCALRSLPLKHCRSR